MAEQAPSVLTMREAADLLRVGQSTLYRLTALGVVPAIKIPGTSVKRVRRSALEALLQEWEGGRRRGRGNGGPR